MNVTASAWLAFPAPFVPVHVKSFCTGCVQFGCPAESQFVAHQTREYRARGESGAGEPRVGECAGDDGVAAKSIRDAAEPAGVLCTPSNWHSGRGGTRSRNSTVLVEEGSDRDP